MMMSHPNPLVRLESQGLDAPGGVNDRSDRPVSVTSIVLIAGLLLLGLPIRFASAESPGQEALERRIEILRERAEHDAERESQWREWHLKLLRDVEHARADLEEKKRAHYALRRRKWRSGKSRGEYSREIDEARTVLRAVQRKLDEFYLRARREGIPPGWVRPPSHPQAEAATAARVPTP